MAALITTGVDAGLVGLVLSYALNTTSSLVRAFPLLMEKLHDSHFSLELACSVREWSRAKHCQCGAHSTSNIDWAGSASWVAWQKAFAGLAVGRSGRIPVGFLWFAMTGPQFTISILIVITLLNIVLGWIWYSRMLILRSCVKPFPIWNVSWPHVRNQVKKSESAVGRVLVNHR